METAGERPTGGQGLVRFLHTADWQLGMRRHYLDEDAQGRFTAARLDAVAAIGRLAREVMADFVVVAGDVFEDNQVDRRTVLRAADVLASFTPTPVLLLPGNHDPMDAGSVYRSPAFAERSLAHVTVLAGRDAVEVVPGVHVVGAPWESKHPVTDLAADACDRLRVEPGLQRVLVAHGCTDTFGYQGENPALIETARLERALAEGSVHYVALGDRHSTTAVGRSGRIWYSGAPEPTDYDEIDPGNVLEVELGSGVRVTPHRVGRWSFRRRAFEVAGDDLSDVRAWFAEATDKPCTIAKIGLQGALGTRSQAELDALLDEARATFAAVEWWEKESAIVAAPDDEALDDLALGGFVRNAITELRGVTLAGGPDAPAAADALGLLYRLAQAGR